VQNSRKKMIERRRKRVFQYSAMLTQYGSNNSDGLKVRGWTRTEEGLPPAGESVLYRTGEHQALGTYEGGNRWRCFNGQVEESPVLLWQPFYSF
jgi:hypothetical protein